MTHPSSTPNPGTVPADIPANSPPDALAEQALIADGAAFEVHLARQGLTLQVPADQTLLHVLTKAGVAMPFSCEQGICGTCLTRVLQGQPDHWDSYLTPDEQAAGDQMMPCCSRSKTARLVLDL